MKSEKEESKRRKEEQIEAAWRERGTAYEPINITRQNWRVRRFEQQNGKCIYCNVPMEFTIDKKSLEDIVTLDHVVPLAKGGDDSFENTVAACIACNSAKSDMSLHEFRSLPWLHSRISQVNTPPDRLSVFPNSPYFDPKALDRGLIVEFRGAIRPDTWEYCISERWVRVPAGRTKDRDGYPLLIRLKGEISVVFEDVKEFHLSRSAVDPTNLSS